MPADLHDVRRRAELQERLRALPRDAVPRFGRMTPDQMLWHLNSALEMGLGELPTKPFHNALRRTVIKFIAMYGPWPKGKVPTARELNARDQHFDFEAERARLQLLIERIGSKPKSDVWPIHPGFGPMSGRAWSLIQSRHVDHHLTQFGG